MLNIGLSMKRASYLSQMQLEHIRWRAIANPHALEEI